MRHFLSNYFDLLLFLPSVADSRYIHKDLTDGLDLTVIINDFISVNVYYYYLLFLCLLFLRAVNNASSGPVLLLTVCCAEH